MSVIDDLNIGQLDVLIDEGIRLYAQGIFLTVAEDQTEAHDANMEVIHRNLQKLLDVREARLKSVVLPAIRVDDQYGNDISKPAPRWWRRGKRP